MKKIALLLALGMRQLLFSQTVYPSYIKVNNVVTPTTFITQTNLTTSVRTSIGYNYAYLKDRVTLYGGNLNVSQNITSSNDYLGKWSTIGAWQMLYNTGIVPMNTPIPVTPGVNYLVNYHRWGNYDAHFGLRERMSDIGIYSQTETGAGSTFNDPNMAIKDAVLSFSYENGATPSRFIIQTIQGIDAAAMRAGSGTYPVATELATILSNGNFGLGVSNPTAKMQLMTNAGFANDYLKIGNPTSTVLILNNSGNLGIGTSNPGSNRLYVEGASMLNGNTNINGVTAIQGNTSITASTVNVTAQFNLKSPANATLTFPLLRLQNSSGDVIQYVNHKGEFFLSSLANGTDNQMLYINSLGKVYGDVVIQPTNTNTYLIGGNTANSFGDRVFGFNDNANISFKVNGLEAFKVWGETMTGINPINLKTGYVEFRNNVAIGGSFIKPVECDYNAVLTLKQGNFRDVNSVVKRHNLILVGDDLDNVRRMSFHTNGFFGIGMDNYTISTTSYSTGLFYDPYKEHLFLDDKKYLYLGFDEVGFCPKMNISNKASQYGLFLRYPQTGGNRNVMNVIELGTSSFGMTRITDDGSEFNGEMVVNGNVLPRYGHTSSVVGLDLGSSQYIWENLYCNTSSSTSDRRLKTDISSIENGLDLVKLLRPVRYKYKNKPDEAIRFGFIAQEIKELLGGPIVTGQETDSTYLGLIYNEFIPLLANAIQIQQKMIDSLNMRINQFGIKDTNTINERFNFKKVILSTKPMLFQNHPNPTGTSTFIDFYLPNGITRAFINITDSNGKLIDSIELTNSGYGQIEADCKNLAEGVYYYSLIIDSQEIDTKSMVIANK